MWQPVLVKPVTEGAELSTKDVDPQWLQEYAGVDPDPERPLSQADLWLSLEIPAGATSAEVTVPTVTDQVAEPAESVRLELTDWEGEPQPGTPALTGTVLDAS